MGLILSDKATLVLNGRGHIHTTSRDVPCPSVIRLAYMVRRPRPTVKLNKQEIFRRDAYTCQYCSRELLRPTLDHVLPRHLGGPHTWENLVTACPACNHKKGGRTLEQANMELLNRPVTPPASAGYIYGKYLKHNEEWQDYISGW